MKQPTRHPQLHVLYLLLALMTICAYLPVLRAGFVNLDDDRYVTENPHVQGGLTPKGIEWTFNVGYQGNWHPVTWVSHMVDWRLFGDMSVGHHAVSLVLHVANTLLLLLLLRRMTGSSWKSALVAGLFAVHPLHVESVAWVAERKDVLSALFWLLTTWAYVRYAESPGVRRYLPLLAFFVLGLMSKPTLVSLPLILLLLDVWPLKRWSRTQAWGLVVEKLPMIALSIASCVVTYIAQQRGGAVNEIAQFSVYGRLAGAAQAYLWYVGKTFWPTGLCAYYPARVGIPVWLTAVRSAVIILLTIMAMLSAKKRPYLAVGWLWYLIVLLPMIGIVQVGGQGMADRYTYVPLIGLFVMLVWGASEILARSPIAVRSAACVVMLLALSVATWVQASYWRDSVTLFTRALAVTKRNGLAHNNLGIALDKLGRKEDAIAQFRDAVRVEPRLADAHNNLGASLAERGDIEGAMTEFEQAVGLDPRFSAGHVNLARALAMQRRYTEAISHYRSALGCMQEADPQAANVRYGLATALAQSGDLPAAIREFGLVVASEPDSPRAHLGIGVAYAQSGNLSDAVKHFLEVIRLQPDNPHAHEQLAIAYYSQGDYAGARREVGLAQSYGGRVNPGFLRALSGVLPDFGGRDGQGTQGGTSSKDKGGW